jgi:putative membrane protein
MMFWYGSGSGWWQGVLSVVFMLAFWGLVAWGIYALARSSRGPAPRASTYDALMILDELLARGEIDQEQYRAARELIRTGGGAGPTAPTGGAW